MTVPAPVGVGRIKFGRWLVGGVALIACAERVRLYEPDRSSGPAQRGPRSTAAPVRVAVAERRDVSVVERTIGTVLPNTAVQVTARVQGVIDAAHFQEGQFVKAGMLLFEIDPRPYVAALAQAKAQLAKDQAQLQNAVNNEKRLRSVYEQKLTSLEQLDAAVAATGSATASVAADQAAIEIAQLNLEYTRVRAPIDGKTGPMLRAAGQSRREQLDRRARHDQPDSAHQGLARAAAVRLAADPGARAQEGGLMMYIDQRDEGGRQYSAPVDFISNHVDDASGTIELRATFANADASLVPGQLVSVSVELGGIAGATVIPREGVNSGPEGQYAYVVTADNKADQRPIKVLYDDGASASIDGNVQPGDRVIVDGQLRVVPGVGVYVDTPKRGQESAATSP